MRLILSVLSVLTLVTNVDATRAGPTALVQRAYIAMPATNRPECCWQPGTSAVAYVLDDPLIGPADSPTTGYVFRDFHAQIFLVRVNTTDGRLTTSKPRLVYRGPRGTSIALGSALGGWLVYEEHDASNVAGPWKIVARNVNTGRSIVLDSRQREGVPSLTPAPRSDGHTVAWQSWTRVNGLTVSVVRTYDLETGERRLIAQGGSPTTWAYTGVSISGQRVAIEKDQYRRRRAQILLYDLRTGRMSSVTPAGKANSEPWVSGDLVVWKVGWNFNNGRGIGVMNVRTNERRFVRAYRPGPPQTIANRYVVFSSVGTGKIRLYDATSGSSRIMAPTDNGYGVGDDVHAAGRLVLYDEGKPCGNPNFVCPGRLVVTRLP